MFFEKISRSPDESGRGMEEAAQYFIFFMQILFWHSAPTPTQIKLGDWIVTPPRLYFLHPQHLLPSSGVLSEIKRNKLCHARNVEDGSVARTLTSTRPYYQKWFLVFQISINFGLSFFAFVAKHQAPLIRLTNIGFDKLITEKAVYISLDKLMSSS